MIGIEPPQGEELEYELAGIRDRVLRGIVREERRRQAPRYLTGGVTAAPAAAAAVIVAVALTQPRPVPPAIGPTTAAPSTSTSAWDAILQAAAVPAAGVSDDGSGAWWAGTGTDGKWWISYSYDDGAGQGLAGLPDDFDPGNDLVGAVRGDRPGASVALSGSRLVVANALDPETIAVATLPFGTSQDWIQAKAKIAWPSSADLGDGGHASIDWAVGAKPSISSAIASDGTIFLFAQFDISANESETITLASHDGGASFAQVSSVTLAPIKQAVALSSGVLALATGAGTSTTATALELSSDGGRTWAEQDFGRVVGADNVQGDVIQLDQLSVSDGKIVVPMVKQAAGTAGYRLFVATTSDGKTLNQQQPILPDLGLADLDYTGVAVQDGTQFYASTQYFSVAASGHSDSYTNQGGVFGFPVQRLAFSSSTNGLLVGTSVCPAPEGGFCPQIILTTDDGGKSWHAIGNDLSVEPSAAATDTVAPADGTGTVLFQSGFAGRYGWRTIAPAAGDSAAPLSDPTEFQVTTDAGATWHDDPLPGGLTAAELDGNDASGTVSIALAPTGAIGIIRVTGMSKMGAHSETMWVQSAPLPSGWTSGAGAFTFDSTAEENLRVAPNAVGITGAASQDGRTIDFLLHFGKVDTGIDPAALISYTDGQFGISVIDFPGSAESLVFADSKHALALVDPDGGQARTSILVTSDGGQHWTSAAVDPRTLRVGDFAWVGAHGDSYLFAREGIDDNGDLTGLGLYSLDEAGSRLQAVGTGLTLDPRFGGAAVSVSGDTVLVAVGPKADGGTQNRVVELFRSDDLGATWRDVGSGGLQVVDDLALSSPTTGVAVTNTCGYGIPCPYIPNTLQRTTDGGETWRPVG